MAKRKGTTKAAAGAGKGSTPVRPSDVLVLIKEKTLKDLLRLDDNYKRDIDGQVGELREAIGNAKEKQHLDTKAYALLKRLHRMNSNEKLANLWHTLLAYMDMTGVMARIDSVQALDLDGASKETEEAEETGEETETSGSVVKPTFGGSRAAH